MAARANQRSDEPASAAAANVVPMTSVAAPAVAPGLARKDLYEVGEIPPLGHVPSKMYAWAIRKERHGPPDRPCRSRCCRPGNSTATTCSFS